MGLDEIRKLLTEARRAMVEWRKELSVGKSHADSSHRLALFKELIAATDEMLKQQDEFAGRLRRTSSFPSSFSDDPSTTDPVPPPSPPDDLSMNAH